MFRKLGYNTIDSNVSFVKLYIKKDDIAKLVIVFDCSEGGLNLSQCNTIEEQVVSACEKDYDNLKVFNLFICDKLSNYVGFNTNDICFIDIENGDSKFFLNGNDEIWQDEVSICKDNSNYIKKYEKNLKIHKKEKTLSFVKDNFKMSVSWIIFLNVVIYLIMAYILHIVGDKDLYRSISYSFGSCYDGVIKEKQVYRVLTSIFIHGGIEHLIGNMISLVVVGRFVEKTIGHLKFLILYLFTGIIADFVSIGYNVYQGNFSKPSIGASGAIFGVIGVFFALLIVDKKILGEFGLTRFAIYIFCNIYVGLRTENVDNAAHIGGVIVGFIIGVIMFYFVPKLKIKNN